MKIPIFLFYLFVFTSCKSQTSIVTEVGAIKDISVDSVIFNTLNKNKIEFSTLSIKASAKYQDAKQSQNVTADIKIQKDQKILVAIRYLGFTLAKALITPTTVQYYEKLGGKFFEGDYITLSNWLGADLDFFKVQNLFLGKPLGELNKEALLVSIVDKLYKLESKIDAPNTNEFFFESGNYLLKKQKFNQAHLNRTLEIIYPNYQKINDFNLPLSIEIDSKIDADFNVINIDYRAITFNEEINFSYSVPEGYEKIIIK